jgi:hypothetical protein
MPLGIGPERFGALCATDRRGGLRFGEDDVALLRLMSLALSPLLDPTGPLAWPPGQADRLDHPTSDREAIAGSESGRSLPRQPDRLEHRPAPAQPATARSEPEASEVDSLATAQQPIDSQLARAVCEAMTAEVAPERVLRSALRAIAETLGAAPVSVYLLETASGELRREAQWEADGAGDRASLPRSGGLCGSVFESGQPLASDQPGEDPRFDPEIDTAEAGVGGPLLVLPLRFRGKTLGIFRAFAARAAAASPHTQEVLGAALSAAVRNVLLYRSLVDSIEEVAQVRKETAADERGS